MDKLLGILKNVEDLELTDELKDKITNVWNDAIKEAKGDTEGMLSQEEVNDIVQKRLARERSTYESELKDLRGKMEDLVDPDQIDEVKGEFEGQIESLEKQRNETVKEYELRLAAAKAGAKDEDYIVFQAEKKGLKDQLGLDDNGNVVLVDEDGNPKKDDDDNLLTAESLVEGMKEEMPLHFGEDDDSGGSEDDNKKNKSSGPTNPGGGDLTDEDKKERSKSMAADLGYKSKEKEE